MLHTILQALEDGRVIELPDNDKKDAFEVLASLLEAVPSVPAGTDIVGAVLSRESVSNTSLGTGWACPHAPVSFDGELLCSLSDGVLLGIDYGKPGEPSGPADHHVPGSGQPEKPVFERGFNACQSDRKASGIQRP